MFLCVYNFASTLGDVKDQQQRFSSTPEGTAVGFCIDLFIEVNRLKRISAQEHQRSSM